MRLVQNPLLMLTALFSLYSPFASVPSYFPVLARVRPGDQRRLALGLFATVSGFGLMALWLGEPLLRLLGLTTSALTVTGGIALLTVGLPLMRGIGEAPADPGGGADDNPGPVSWKAVLSMPITFPLTVGGTSFAIMVSFRSQARNLTEVAALSVAAIAHAGVTAVTLYVSGHLHRRLSPRTRLLLKKIAGILLTAIAVSLILNGAPRMVMDTVRQYGNG